MDQFDDSSLAPHDLSFESLKKHNQHDVEYWSTRDLQPCLGYSQWRYFENAPDWPILRRQLAELYLESGEVEAAEKEANKGFELASLPPKKISNAVEYYYENLVTGRAWENPKERFDILEKIHKIKTHYSQYKLSGVKAKIPDNLSHYLR